MQLQILWRVTQQIMIIIREEQTYVKENQAATSELVQNKRLHNYLIVYTLPLRVRIAPKKKDVCGARSLCMCCV